MKEDKLIKQFITLGIITALVLICAVCCMVSVIQGYLFGYSEAGLMIIGVILCILLIVAFSIFDYVLIKEYIKDYEDEQKRLAESEKEKPEGEAVVCADEEVATTESVNTDTDGDKEVVELATNEPSVDPVKKKRGRPRKKPVDEVKE